MSGRPIPAEERFYAHAFLTESGCLETDLHQMPSGYAQFWNGESKELVHRYAYRLMVGPLADGVHVHHRCGNRACANPIHLEALSTSDHAQEHLLDACKHGHLFTPANTRIGPDGRRACRACDARRAAEARARDPEPHRASSRAYHHRNREAELARMRARKARP